MVGDSKEGDVFAIPDFWQRSTWLEQPEVLSPSLFGRAAIEEKSGHPAGLAIADLSLKTPFNGPKSTQAFFDVLSLDNDGFFRLPPLAGDGPREPSPEVSPEPADAVDGAGIVEAEEDFWLDAVDPPQKKACFRSWDAFDAGAVSPHQPMFLSEAGPNAYDALLSLPADPLQLENSEVPIVEAEPYFSSLLALALGRDSIFFTKNETTGSFKPTLPALRISGYSQQVLQGLEGQAHWCGSTFVQLRKFSRSAYDILPSRCGVALASSMTQVLQAVEQRVAVDGGRPRSLLQLQATIKEVLTILKYLRRMASKLRPNCPDEDILSLVYHTASSVDDGENYIRYIFREILKRVSAPWIETIEEWIGTRQEGGMPITKSNVGDAKGFVKVEAEAYVDDFGREEIEVDFRLDSAKIPDFMPKDVVDTIFETGRNLRFIKAFHPKHLLAQEALIEMVQPPKAEWHYNWDSILDLESRVSRYKSSLQDALERSRHGSTADLLGTKKEKTTEPFALQYFGLDQTAMEERITTSMAQLGQPMEEVAHEELLARIVREGLTGHLQPASVQSDATPHWSLLPVLSFGGIASAQAQIVNRETLRLLFDAHDIRNHLGLQREFQLLGNGMFCSRLSHALFDPDLESAERQAGIAMQGGVMGLRLGSRDTWPPASSELRLALMGVLTESYAQRHGSGSDSMAAWKSEASSLPGDLSFAVRDLSPEEIDKCINPDSLEALDFLRLSYKTPPELTSVITPINLMHYDSIFKLLLRVLRMLHVVNQLHVDVTARTSAWEEPGALSFRFAREAQRFVGSVASYFLDSGVAIPWRAFERRLDKVRAELDDDEVTGPAKLQSPDQLRELHSQVIDGIMFALFLRKRQQPVLKVLEDLFAIILQYAEWSRLHALGRGAQTSGEAEAAKLYTQFKKKMQVFITVCRGLSEKGKAGEIDHNFSKAHRIVTTSILPLVEQYGEHSRGVWDASKFWKQFFEASANVSLSGYEELANDDESSAAEDSTAMRDDTTTDYTGQHDGDEDDATRTTATAEQSTLHGDESLLDDAELTGSTPRPPATKTIRAQLSPLESPYEAMKREMEGEEDAGATTVLEDDDDEDSTVLFAQRTARLPDMSMTPRGLGGLDKTLEQSTQRQKDPLLHRVLDKNYRLQATPHKPAYRISPLKKPGDASSKDKAAAGPSWRDDSPMSSPEMAVPTLRSEAFMSPFKSNARQRLAAATQRGPRTPGVSVQTPGTARKTRDALAGERKPKYEIDWESDGEDEDGDLYAGMSPPKTIQFALPPSKLLQTPAREASRRIVDDILIDAGADPESSEYSPTMVKMNEDILNDSF
ncbi:Helicase-like transcription factor [Purpureocillium lavendulum]|uniref:DASH complex subunit ASK1 n=1 Tax=Purpureocillium lavendulum TaxID=1247861 RepID=A0AB34G0A1_9HYPO|nr:Helicase-like transcription factor [Purpureocillium lavendulum]